MNKFLVLTFAALLTACGGAGSGEGLDDQGLPTGSAQPSPEPSPSPTPDPGTDDVSLQQLQTEIFGAICAACHTGATAPQGLRLDSAENSYNFLVGVEAEEAPQLLRVDPGDPDNSYVVHKIEGEPDIVGGRMPLGQPALSDTQIQMIRDWISAGAPPATANSLKLTEAAMVDLQKAEGMTRMNVYFTDALQENSLSEDNILLYLHKDGTDHLIHRTQYTVYAQEEVLSVIYHGEVDAYQSLYLQLEVNGLDKIRDQHGNVVNTETVTNMEGGIHYVSM